MNELKEVVTNSYFILASIVMLVIVMIAYIKKNKIHTVENFVFNMLICSTILMIIVDIIHLFTAPFTENNNGLIIISKLTLVCQIVFLGIFSMYVIAISSKNNDGYVSFNKNKFKKYYENLFTIIGIYVIGLSSLIAYLPIEVVIGKINFGGQSLVIAYDLFLVFVGIWLILMLMNVNSKTMKKYYPILAIIIIEVLCYALYIHNQDLVIFSAASTFSVTIIYMTMENPDITTIKNLEIAKETVSKANTDKTEFLSNVSKEIRTPLNAIIGLSHFLKNEQLSQSANEQLNDILMSSDGLLEIINGILDISKIEENIIEINPYEYSFRRLCSEVISLAKSRLNSSGKPIEFDYKIDENIPKVLYGDMGRIKEILINFLTNSVKYTKEGKITFLASGIVSGDICTLTLSVQDTGIGIKEENKNKLFTQFQRFDLEKNNAIEGTGLGLSITKKMIELMGGKIEVESVYGKGSKFSAIINQRIVDKEDDFDEIDSNPLINVQNQRILVYDENPINNIVSKKILGLYNAKVETYQVKEDIINKLKQGERYDLILIDEDLPVGQGNTLYEYIRANPEIITPVVAFTANAISGMREKYLSIGYSDFITKPLDQNEIKRILKKYLKVTEIKQEVNTNMNTQLNNIPTATTIPTVVEATIPVQVVPTVVAQTTPVVVAPETTTPVVTTSEIVAQTTPVVVAPETTTPVVTTSGIVAQTTPVVGAPETTTPVVTTSEIVAQTTSVIAAPQTTIPVAEAPTIPVIATPVVAMQSTPTVETASPVMSAQTVPAIQSQVVETVQQATPIVEQPVQVAGVQTPIVPAPNGNNHTREFLEANGADINKALEVLGDMEMYDSTVDDFLADYENQISKIKTYKETGDLNNYGIETHALKTNARYIGFMELGEIAYAHEKAGKAADANFINQNYDNLISNANHVYEVLKQYKG